MRYRVDSYDMFDGWIGGTLDDPNEFDDLGQAVALRDKRNGELDEANKLAGEHYGVIDLERGTEVDCPAEKDSWPKPKATTVVRHCGGGVLNRAVPQPNIARVWPANPAKESCPLCQGTGEVLERPARLMGATYPESDPWKGDEHFVPCPLCKKKSQQ